jgi:hypothetical protein
MGREKEGFVVTLATVAFIVGCSSDLPAASDLERTRALGARVQVAATDPAQPQRASVLPGEAASVEWLVASQSGDAGPFAWTFATCVAIDGACVEAPVANGGGTGLPVLVPFTTPDASELTTPRVPLMAGTLEGIDDVRFAIPVETPGAAPNHHPNLANDTVLFNGAPWDPTAAAPPPGAPCDATTGLLTIVPRASTGKDASDAEKVAVRLITDADDRETYVPPAGGAPVLEDLQISNFGTAGAFDGSYAEIPPSDSRPDADAVMKWAPPSFTAVPSVGLVVQIHLVMRDGRGGLDWLHRSLCVLAP